MRTCSDCGHEFLSPSERYRGTRCDPCRRKRHLAQVKEHQRLKGNHKQLYPVDAPETIKALPLKEDVGGRCPECGEPGRLTLVFDGDCMRWRCRDCAERIVNARRVRMPGEPWVEVRTVEEGKGVPME